MADTAVDAKEVAPAPEKEVVEKKGEEVAEVEEKEKVSENGTKNGVSAESKENGNSEEEAEEVESTENGTTEESSEVPVATKRKSTGGDDAVTADAVTPEKKAKLAEPEEEEASNGAAEAEATA